MTVGASLASRGRVVLDGVDHIDAKGIRQTIEVDDTRRPEPRVRGG